jgi:hypothetical protein
LRFGGSGTHLSCTSPQLKPKEAWTWSTEPETPVASAGGTYCHGQRPAIGNWCVPDRWGQACAVTETATNGQTRSAWLSCGLSPRQRSPWLAAASVRPPALRAPRRLVCKPRAPRRGRATVSLSLSRPLHSLSSRGAAPVAVWGNKLVTAHGRVALGRFRSGVNLRRSGSQATVELPNDGDHGSRL